MDFAVSADHRVKIENKNRKWKYKKKISGPGQRTEKNCVCDTNCSWTPWNIPQKPRKETRGKKESKPSRSQHS